MDIIYFFNDEHVNKITSIVSNETVILLRNDYNYILNFGNGDSSIESINNA